MDDLDQLKELWKTTETSTGKLDSRKSEDAIAKYQRKVRRSNILSTFFMSGTIIFLISLMFLYPEESWLFYVSICLVVILSASAILVMWTRALDSSKQLSMSSVDYTAYKLKKLRRSRKIIEYSPLYGLVLGILVNAYAYSLIEHATGEFIFWMTNINWVYIIVISYISYRVKMKRYLRDVQPIVDELEAFQT